MKTWILKHKIITSVLVVILVGIGWQVLAGGADPMEQVEISTVERQSVQQIISETGVVEAVGQADLSFSASGQVQTVSTEEGDTVAAGDVIARLSANSLQASVAQAQAELDRQLALLSRQEGVDQTSVAAAETKVQSAEENLQQVRETQNELVRAAREDLYTSNLSPYLAEGEDETTDDDFTPPTISGTYNSTESGEYRINFYKSSAPSGWSFHISGLESGSGRVSTSQPQPLGDRGLFIQFPEDFARGQDLEWVLSVPNTRSSQYATLKNALEKAEDTRESAITQAENNLEDAQAALDQSRSQAEFAEEDGSAQPMTSQQAAVASARASLQQAQANLEDTILRAPFSGTLASLDIDAGEHVSPGQAVGALISDEPFQVSVGIPEVDSANVEVGDTAEIVLDAYPDETFTGEVISVAPMAKTVNGVQNIEVTVSITDADERVKVGLSADVDIIAAQLEDVVAVPRRAVQETPEETFVYQENEAGNGLVRQSVTTGLRGSEGVVEITSGLSVGDEVVTFINQDIRNQLEANGRIE